MKLKPNTTILGLTLLAAVLALLIVPASAQVPQIISYQGRVVVGTTNFDGSGHFKFALVDAAGTTTYWSNDGTSTAGSEPTTAVTLTVTKGLYSVLLGDTMLANMTAIPNSAFNNADVRLRVWFNDGTNGSQLLTPDQRIAAVGYAMVADNVTDGAITAAKIANGAVGSAQIGTGAVTSAKIAAGAVGATQLSGGAAALNLDASTGIVTTPGESPALVAAGYLRTGSLNIRAEGWTQSATKPGPFPREEAAAVWTGTEMLVWGGKNGQANNEGARYNPTTGAWTPMSNVNAPAARYGHRAVWTGSEMIIIGGLSSQEPPPNPINGQTYAPGAVGGGRYNPTTDTWTLLPSAPRIYNHIAVWNGTDVLILGGYGLSVGSGGLWLATQNTLHSLYNPAANTFTPLSSPPGGVGAVTTNDLLRHSHSGIWSGSEFIVWGGARFAGNIRGWRWAPATNTWTVMASSGAPSEAPGHTSVWTGSEVIIWGGGAGRRYNPTSNTWTTMSTTGVTNSVTNHTAIWDGSQMNVFSASGTHRYDPALNVWTGTAMTAASTKHVAVWAGTEMLAWGGAIASVGNTGNRLHRYTPSTDTYAFEKLAPYGRKGHTAVWTGSNMIIFGGTGAGGLLSEPAGYSPASDEWFWLPFLGAPSARRDHSAVWKGTEMIIWGGGRRHQSTE